jgi:hypothetical protein
VRDDDDGFTPGPGNDFFFQGEGEIERVNAKSLKPS